MPSLTTVSLNKTWAFRFKKTALKKSPSPSPLSFLDITPALLRYLSFPLSFTHYSSHVHHQLIQQENTTTPHNHSTPAFLTKQPHQSIIPSHTHSHPLPPPPTPIPTPHSIQPSTPSTNPALHVDAHTKSKQTGTRYDTHSITTLTFSSNSGCKPSQSFISYSRSAFSNNGDVQDRRLLCGVPEGEAHCLPRCRHCNPPYNT